MRILYLGMDGIFSAAPLARLLAGGYRPVALIQPRAARDGQPPRRLLPPPPAGDLPLLPSPARPAAAALAWRGGVPVYEVDRLNAAPARALLADLAPDLIVVACFSRLLPPAWLAAPALGCLNLHPSLLPRYRGPEPLFWQFRAAETDTGVTLHFLDDGVDSGDIVAQTPVALPPGIDMAGAEQLTATAGAELLLTALAAGNLPRRPQDEAAATRQPLPDAAARVVPVDWSARRAFNFVRGAADWGPFTVRGPAGELTVTAALELVPGGRLNAPWQSAGAGVAVQFADGVVWFSA